MPKSPLLRIYCVWMLLDLLTFLTLWVMPNPRYPFSPVDIQFVVGCFIFIQLQMLGAVYTVLFSCEDKRLLSILPYYLLILIPWFHEYDIFGADPLSNAVSYFFELILLTFAGIVSFVLLMMPYTAFVANDFYLIPRSKYPLVNAPAWKWKFSLKSLFFLTTVSAVVFGIWRSANAAGMDSWIAIVAIGIYHMPAMCCLAYLREEIDYVTLAITSIIVLILGLPFLNAEQMIGIATILFLFVQYGMLFSTCLILRCSGYRLMQDPFPRAWKLHLPIKLNLPEIVLPVNHVDEISYVNSESNREIIFIPTCDLPETPTVIHNECNKQENQSCN